MSRSWFSQVSNMRSAAELEGTLCTILKTCCNNGKSTLRATCFCQLSGAENAGAATPTEWTNQLETDCCRSREHATAIWGRCRVSMSARTRRDRSQWGHSQARPLGHPRAHDASTSSSAASNDSMSARSEPNRETAGETCPTETATFCGVTSIRRCSKGTSALCTTDWASLLRVSWHNYSPPNAASNHYLARIGAPDSEVCACGWGVETVRHYLFRCPQWGEIQRNLRVHSHRAGETMHSASAPGLTDVTLTANMWTETKSSGNQTSKWLRGRWSL